MHSRLPNFEIAGGSVRGRDHEKLNRNNQDAFVWSNTEQATIAIVCDGCGSGLYSEVGARIGARLGLGALCSLAPNLHCMSPEIALKQLQTNILEQLQNLTKAMGDSFFDSIYNHFLFTIVGAILTPSKTIVFTLGDGVLAINGDYKHIAYANNMPPYLAYGLIPETLEPTLHKHLDFKIHWQGDTNDVQEILIGTDGVNDLYLVAEQNLPGKSEQVGLLNQFWSDKYFKNPYAITRRLNLINRTVNQCNWEQQRVHKESGLLADDTTLIVIRRKSQSQ